MPMARLPGLLEFILASMTDQQMPSAGDLAPDFTLSDQDGNLVTLSDLRGQTVVLYFYPRADTRGSFRGKASGLVT